MSNSNRSTSLIFLSCLLLVSSTTTTAFNITKILERDPNYSNFSDLLIKTNLVGEINSRKTITVLAIPNAQIGDLAGKPLDVSKIILRNHVVLDYFDIIKLQRMNKPTMMTTLFQTTGVASYEQGFLNVTKSTNGEIIFASAVHGAPRDVHLLGSVMAQPFNISVLSVSHNIVTPGIDAITLAPPPKTNAPAPTKTKVPPPAPSTEAPSPSDVAPAPNGPPADAPGDSPADAPDSHAPSAEPPASDAADAKPAKGAGSKHLASSSLGMLLVLASFFAAY